MGLVNGIWLAVLGILGAANLIIARKPEAKELIGKLAPYQGWIGAVSAIWGAVGIVLQVLNIALLTWAPILWITGLANCILEFALGLLLGVGVLKTFIKNPAANQKMDATITKLAPYQGTLGLIAIGVGIWMVIAGFLFTVAVATY
jgi:hypothetical protein